mgnify:CR=1 FL=1
MQQAKLDVEFPPLRCAKYIVEYMRSIGFPSPSEGYVKHSEIKAFCDQYGITLEPVEHQMIFNGFIEYSSAKSQYEQAPLEPAPFNSRTDEEIKAERVANVFASLRNGK